MITQTILPITYKPYQRLTVCSNQLIGGGHLVVIDDVLPLLVGCGEAPMVWLQAPVDQTGKAYVQLVAASVALHPAVSVVSDKEGLTVYVGGTSVIHVIQTDFESAKIDLLDLRPVGLNISGNADSLIAGGANLSHNTFSGGGAMLAFGAGN
jgi:hypothetical protein